VTRGDGVVSGTARRPLLKLAVGGAALASVGVAARVALHPGDEDEPPTGAGGLVLAGLAGSDVKSLEVRLGDELLPQQSGRRWESERLPTSVHSMVGFTWGVDERPPTVRVRSRVDERWGAWQRVPQLQDVPEDTERLGTDLVWIGRATGVQVRVDGDRPRDLTLVLLHPARRAADQLIDQELAARSSAGTEEEPTAQMLRPKLITRAEWGANESLRSGRPSYIDLLKQVHVHHTVNANDYSRSDVPALVRGMYAYHTQSLGWSDIGYNFLVDRFGRTYVGRAGGPDKLVRGAHTLGFNHNSTGISCIGNLESGQPSSAMLDGVAAIAAWKLAKHGGKPRGTVMVRSEGSDRFSSGRVVELPVIDGHRDTNETACPGKNLYAKLPAIRRRTARLMKAAAATPITVEKPAHVSGRPALGETVTVDPGSWTPQAATASFLWFRDDTRIYRANRTTYTVRPKDVGHRLTCRVRLNGEDLEAVDQMPEPLAVATAQAVLDFDAVVRRRSVKVAVEVRAPQGVTPDPTGQVTVTVGDRSKTVDLEDGRAVARFGRSRRSAKNRYPVSVQYAGESPFTAASATGTART
jgi:hypothetical protein